jgi:methylenetetrahydrofolate dehydrogenase (NADP+)/methenyltetrahydrofolate cyclohydrolase
MIIDGKQIASEILSEIAQKITHLKRKPGLAFILIGNNPASETYVGAKVKACAKVGIRSKLIRLSTEAELLTQISELNRDPHIDGILVQLPLPAPIHEARIMTAIDPTKDVDGFHPLNAGKLLQGDPAAIVPCTPQGIQIMLQKSHIPVEGKHVVIIGRSNIVGKPLAALLMQKRSGCNATVTLCHSGSEHLSEITRSADILVAAIGKPHFIRKEMIKPHSVVIDVGINRVNQKIVGDVDFEEISPVASHITPVPGGVGPMTIAMLMHNTLRCYQLRGGK